MKSWLRAAVLVAAGVAAGQAQYRANWWNSPVTQEIGLSSGQSQQIREIVHSYRGRLLDARSNVLKAQGDLKDVMDGPTIDMREAHRVIGRLSEAQAASSKVLLEMSVQLRGVLTIDQWRQLVKRWDEIKGRRRSDTQTPP